MYRDARGLGRLGAAEDDAARRTAAAADDDDSCKCVFLAHGFRIRFSFRVNEFAIACS